MKQAILEMMKSTPADKLKNDLDSWCRTRDYLYTLLIPVINEIKAYDNSDEENEANIETLFQKKDMIEQTIGVLNGIIVTLAKGQNQ